MSLLQIILVLVLVLIVFGTGAVFLLNQESARKKRFAGIIKGHAVATDNKVAVRNEQDKRRAEIAKKLKDSKDEDERKGKKKKPAIGLMLEQAGLTISVKKFWLLSFACMGACALTAQMLGQPLPLIAAVAVTGLLGVPRLVVKHLRGRRQKKFLEEFADALEAMIRLLKAGMPISEAVSMISREFTGPVGEEMSRIYDKQKIGIPLHEAALEATRRMPLPEMQMFATGLAIQAQTGSSLSEVLKNLAGVIRARFKLKRKIKALSSEAIASASIIGALPNLLALSMYFANREYIMVLFTDPFGNVLLAGAVVWMTIGMIVMKVMINFKI